MINSEYNIDINKSVKISIGAVIRNQKILKFILIILKLKKRENMQLKSYYL